MTAKQSVLVTGVAGGIGAACVRYMAGGAEVTAFDRGGSNFA